MSTANRKSMEPWIKDSVVYYPHQVEGIRRMAVMRSFLLADDMGLGKSLQALTVFAIDVARGLGKNCLVVCPAGLKDNWAAEIEKFTGGISHLIVSNAQVKKSYRKEQISRFSKIDGPKILIVNYEQVVSLKAELNQVGWDMIIWDEAHMIKNPTSKRTKASHDLLTRRAALLTGSPVLNHVNDLWSLLHRIAPGDFGTYHKFLNRYAVYGGYQSRQITGIKNEQELLDALGKVMIRRMKTDVLDLPDVQYIDRIVKLTTKQKKHYEEVVKNMQLTSPDGEVEEIDNALTKFLRLKQICGTTATVEDEDSSFKLDAAQWDAENIMGDGNKVVAFTQFRGVHSAYMKRMLAASVAKSPRGEPKFLVWELHGDIESGQRQAVLNAWANHDGPALLVCMFQVAGVGLNMTAARHGQFLDKLFVPALNKQAVDRMHRIGADLSQPVQILQYLCKDTVEERVEKILSQKTKVSDSLIKGDADMEEYKALVRKIVEEEAKKYNG